MSSIEGPGPARATAAPTVTGAPHFWYVPDKAR